MWFLSPLSRSVVRSALVVFLVLPLCSGCGVFRTLLKVNPDGSGTIVQTIRLNAMATQFMSSMATTDDSARQDADNPPTLFTKKKIRARAAQFGDGVHFVRMERLDERGGKGYRAVYAFDDVRTVHLLPGEQMDIGDDAPGASADDAKTKTPITFDFSAGVPATLTMHLGGLAAPDASVNMGRGPPDAPDTSNTARQKRMARMMLRDAEMRIDIEPQGTLVGTDAKHRTAAGRITLMALNFNELMADPQAFDRFLTAKNQGRTDADTERMIRALPGIRLETKEAVTMRFE
ncbi:hypothetical protein BSZ35_16050 [Salinibacter sp. 10B]|uniref:hypothetical protein n=1 Tax=Salinibacter sp. 10B TaxID=1923971 RepID=UPI000CF3AEBC|nr:hypothetical protein [Salinibacter sp. 10B]PQJ35913.1 hypothetical protein BSZ35_16050 [Salinibacter sp. 10B]